MVEEVIAVYWVMLEYEAPHLEEKEKKKEKG
jgi:hypothetical protein